MKRELEDKENVERDLVTNITGIYHQEEIIGTLERETRRLAEKVGSLEFCRAAVAKEKEMLTEKFDEIKKNILDYGVGHNTEKSAKDYDESKVSKYLQPPEDTETNLTS